MKFMNFLAACMLLLASCTVTRVDSIVHNAKIYTVDKDFAIAGAMAIDKGRIVATGSQESILKKYHSNNKIDANGHALFPGFIDAHAHFTGYATDKWKLDVVGTASFAAIVEKLKAYSLNAPMHWLYGRGWDQNDWEVKEFPDNKLISALFPDRPVYLKRIDGHAALANKAALQLAGITAQTKMEGGQVVVKDGEPTGILIDNAMWLVEEKVPQPDVPTTARFMLEMQRECFAYGLTSIHDAGLSNRSIELIDSLQKADLLKIRLYAMLADVKENYDTWLPKGVYKTERLNVGGFKIYADGALGSRGACLLKEYSDQPAWKGFLLSDTLHFKSVAKKLAATNFQMNTHAIGDSAGRFLLNTYLSVLPNNNDRRWRIEHAQILNENDFGLFKKGNIIPSVQPTHATSDMYWAGDRIGAERLRHAYAYQDLLIQNGWIALGTDFPVEDISPFKTFLAAVGRVDAKMYPSGGFQMDNALSREETIRGMTIWAARAAFEEKEKGSLEKGKFADFIILSQDLMQVPIDQILSTKVVSTYLNGEKVY